MIDLIEGLFLAHSPSPSPAPQVDPQLGSPGFIGFVSIFLVAVALILLVMSMGRHLRKVQRNERLRAAAEEAAAGADETVTDEAIADELLPHATAADQAVAGTDEGPAERPATDGPAGDDRGAPGETAERP